jgi:CDP-diacylglycerol---glycerol-3-phosphate 3-phosphatidyltransferase
MVARTTAQAGCANGTRVTGGRHHGVDPKGPWKQPPAESRLSLYALKPRFQACLRPLVGMFARAGITANEVTVAAAVVSVAVGVLVAWRLPDTRAFLLIPLWMLVRMAFNAIDGMLAREFGQQSRLGAYLNELTDVIADTALYVPFALLAPFAPAWVGLVIVLAVISEYAGALGAMVGASRRYDGPMGKSDRALVFGALGLWVGLASPLPAWAEYFMPVLAALIVLTIINRVRRGLSEGT